MSQAPAGTELRASAKPRSVGFVPARLRAPEWALGVSALALGLLLRAGWYLAGEPLARAAPAPLGAASKLAGWQRCLPAAGQPPRPGAAGRCDRAGDGGGGGDRTVRVRAGCALSPGAGRATEGGGLERARVRARRARERLLVPALRWDSRR